MSEIIASLAMYPYGCGEQLLSSTLPNVLIKQLSQSFAQSDLYTEEVQENIEYGLSEIYKMQNEDGGFKYWHSAEESSSFVSSYALRIFIRMQEAGIAVENERIERLLKYLKAEYAAIRSGEAET